jgi:hypothetical protein
VSRPLIRAWYALTVSFLACLVVAIASVGYASWVNHKAEQRSEQARRDSDQRWCGLFTVIDPPEAPPTTERGQVIAEKIHELRVSFGCPER